MKIIIFLMFIEFTASMTFSQSQTKAPIKGKLLEKEITVKYIRIDGSEFTKYNDGSDWYLTKEASNSSKMKIPVCVKTIKPTKIIYKTMNGDAFSTYDFKNWVRYDENENYQPVNNDNQNILEVTKQPIEPVSEEFFIEFILKTDTDVSILITDMEGRVIKNSSIYMKSGINHFSLTVENLGIGSYSFKITAGLSFYNGMFIKI